MRKCFGNEPLKDITMERVRVEEFKESLCKDYGWVNLVFLWGFSLNILFRSSLHFVGIRGIYTCVCLECEESVFQNKAGWRLGLVTWLSCEFKPRTNWMVVWTFCPVVLQLAWRFNFSACLARVQLLVACKPRATHKVQLRIPTTLHKLEHFFTLFHTLPLHDSHLNIGLLIAKIQANLVWNKANKMVD